MMIDELVVYLHNIASSVKDSNDNSFPIDEWSSFNTLFHIMMVDELDAYLHNIASSVNDLNDSSFPIYKLTNICTSNKYFMMCTEIK